MGITGIDEYGDNTGHRGQPDGGPPGDEIRHGTGGNFQQKDPEHEPGIQEQYLGKFNASPFGIKRNEYGRDEVHVEEQLHQVHLPYVGLERMNFYFHCSIISTLKWRQIKRPKGYEKF